MQRDGVIVLGMHRSGTSAVTSVLNAMGLHVGAPDELIATSGENPRGFFERRDLRRICDALLQRAGADWWRVSDFSVDTVPPAVRADNEERIRALKAHLDTHGPWVIKEPRLCLLLPVFEAFARRAVIVHPIRSPLEVARSLARRNGMPLCAGIALWDRYNRAAAAFSRDCPRVSVDYGRLVAEPAAACARLARDLEAAGIGPLDAEAGAARIEPDLHRERADARREHDFVGPPQAALWRAVVENDTTGIDAASGPAVVEALREYERAMAERAAVAAALDREREKLDALLASRSWRLTGPLRRCGGLLRRFHRD